MIPKAAVLIAGAKSRLLERGDRVRILGQSSRKTNPVSSYLRGRRGTVVGVVIPSLIDHSAPIAAGDPAYYCYCIAIPVPELCPRYDCGSASKTILRMVGVAG